MTMHLMCFDYKIVHVSGKVLFVPDTLSRAPVHKPEVHKQEEIEEELFVDMVLRATPFTDSHLQEIYLAQNKDGKSQSLKEELLHGFKKGHSTSSSRFPQSNGEAGSAVAITKKILMKSQDLNLGLLAHQTSPLESEYSSAEVLFGWKLRIILPAAQVTLPPHWEHEMLKSIRKRDTLLKERDKKETDSEVPEKEGGTVGIASSITRDSTVKVPEKEGSTAGPASSTTEDIP
ncbi:hypothetical protein PR048_005638 [Dryococelus australis]|uniref:Uncharacterized protein n=1 Tax=Dryococelus australis TaxID=614101 RepID=A0ABQ9I8Q4_9NEOP|nr:hypothetical protein PR048_005638 [Dryococelus australis]